MFDFPVPGGNIVHKFSRTKKNPYDGIGIRAKRGSRILAPKNGRVLFVGDDGTKFGLIIILEHQDPFLTVYAHLDQAFVKVGQQLQRGDTLGTVGSSGGIGFPHLHFQIRMGQKPQDPMLYLKRP
jgi:murein DD-endopeptidase MepM/ murein hydrolase activator NlpD